MSSQVGARYDVVVIGAGAAGLSVIASLLKRQPDINIALAAPQYRDDIPTDRHAKPSCNFDAS